MIQVKCINKIRNKQGVIQYYTLVDKQGNQKTVTADALKRVIRSNQLECINLILTSDNRLIDKNVRTKLYSIKKNQIKRELTPIELYKEYLKTPYMKKIKTLGVKPEIEYRIDGEDVLIEKVHIKNGTVILQPFVTGLYRYNYDTERPKCKAFEECIDIKIINKSNITDLSDMFYSCDKLKKIDLSSFDSSKIVYMCHTFSNCKNLIELNLSNINTSQVRNMRELFAGCKKLEKLDLSSFDTSKVESMHAMFWACKNLKELKLNNFNTSKVHDMQEMFSDCNSLRELDLSSFDTSHVSNMAAMFEDCINLEKLNIHNFDTSSLDFTYSYGLIEMFQNCANLKNLDISNFIVAQKNIAGSSIFSGCNYKHTFKVPKEFNLELNRT